MLLTMTLLFLLYAGFFSLGLLINIPLPVVIGLALGGLVIHLVSSEWIVRHALGAGLQPAASSRHGADLQALVERVAMQAGARAPRLMVMESPVPNACALGTSPGWGTIVVTKGLLALDLR